MRFSEHIGSSTIRTLADDAEKDDDNVAFLAELPLGVQASWLVRLRWLRTADRLAENQLIEPESGRFDSFRRGWRALVDLDEVSEEHEDVWREMRATLWTPSRNVIDAETVLAFDGFLEALADYTQKGLRIATQADHDRMLARLTGNLFGVFPYWAPGQRERAMGFAMLDQAMNNLRDIDEDAARGICFFPADVLAEFGVPLESILDRSAVSAPGYPAMMVHWLDEVLPRLRRGAQPFVDMTDLHPSLALMRRSFLDRYARIERAFRESDFDYRTFARSYFSETAKQDVA